jgi:predicted Zn-ribbon and HTH transcriptional regulator
MAVDDDYVGKIGKIEADTRPIKLFTNPKGPDTCKVCGKVFEAREFNLPHLCSRCDLER